jgi:ATP-dependent DNA ligase
MRDAAGEHEGAIPGALMLATLSDERELGEEWALERKLDGERCVAIRAGDDVRLESRTGKALTTTYPEVRDAVAAQATTRLVLDGEVVAFDGDATSFGRLQQRLGTRSPGAALVAQHPVVYCVFDVLEADGDDLRDLPYRERRARLERSVAPQTALRLTDVWSGDSRGRFERACRAPTRPTARVARATG